MLLLYNQHVLVFIHLPHDVKMVNGEECGVDNVQENKTIDWSQRDFSENIASWGYVCAILTGNTTKNVNKMTKNTRKARSKTCYEM